MENIEQRVKKIVAEQLGVNKRTSRTSPPLSTISARIRWIRLNWSWPSKKKNSRPRFRTSKPRRSRPFNRRSISYSPTRSNSNTDFPRGPARIDSAGLVAERNPVRKFSSPFPGAQFGTPSSCHHRPGDRLSGRQYRRTGLAEYRCRSFWHCANHPFRYFRFSRADWRRSQNFDIGCTWRRRKRAGWIPSFTTAWRLAFRRSRMPVWKRIR